MISQPTRKLLTIIGLSFLTGIVYATPAKAQLNLSDLGGINIWNNIVPMFGFDSTLSSETIDTAESLSEQLDQAYQDCLASTQSLQYVPRRFARGEAPEICITSECQALERLKLEAQEFFNTLDTTQREQLSDMGLKVW